MPQLDFVLPLFGPARLTSSPEGLAGLAPAPEDASFGAPCRDPLLCEAQRQLEAFFAGRLRVFDLPLDLQGTHFQRRVWDVLLAIPWGETRSYAQVAQAAGSPKAARAVGLANRANPLPIIVPCHRVVHANGTLGGYGLGIGLKRSLLALEGQSGLST